MMTRFLSRLALAGAALFHRRNGMAQHDMGGGGTTWGRDVQWIQPQHPRRGDRRHAARLRPARRRPRRRAVESRPNSWLRCATRPSRPSSTTTPLKPTKKRWR
jgi:hypothetical protein